MRPSRQETIDIFPPVAPQRVLRAVIFDMDGLLVDSEPFWRQVESRIFDEYGVDVRPYLGHGLTMGLRVDDAVSFLGESTGLVLRDIEAVASRVVAGVIDAINDEAELLPGALDAVEHFRERGLRVGLASGSVPEVIEAVLQRFSLAGRFEVIASAIDDQFGKPHPSIFLRTAHLLGIEPSSCLVFEDSLNGVVAAKAARMTVVAVPHADDLADPRYAIADLTLKSLLEIDDGRVDELIGR